MGRAIKRQIMNANKMEKPSRGGARPGAGAPSKPPELRKTANRARKTVDITIDEDVAIRALAASEGVTAHAWMVRAIRLALAAATATGVSNDATISDALANNGAANDSIGVAR